MSSSAIARPGAFLVLAAAVAVSACEVNLNTQGLSTTDKKTFEVKGRPEVVLDTFDGSVEIHSWDRNEVEVEVERRAMEQSLIDEMTITAEQEGDRVVVRVTGPKRAEQRGVTIGVHVSPSARLRVAVPRAANLDVKSGDGSIRVEEVEGTIVLNTEDGSVTAERLSGDVKVHTADGAIRVDRVAGRLQFETNDGSISGDVDPVRLFAKTGDGSVRLRVAGDQAMADDWNLETGDGSVVLTLPASFNAEIDAETSDGSVRSSHPALRDAMRERDEDRDERRDRRRTLRERMGEGGKTIRLRTGDGSIRIEG